METQQLAQLVAQRHACVRDLHVLSLRQLEQIAEGDFTQLLRVFGGKQRLLARLHEIERRLDPFRGVAPEKRRWDSEQKRVECARLNAECEQMLSEIVAREQQSEQQLTAGRDAAAAQLQQLHAVSCARGAYQSDSHVGLSQLDLSSEG